MSNYRTQIAHNIRQQIIWCVFVGIAASLGSALAQDYVVYVAATVPQPHSAPPQIKPLLTADEEGTRSEAIFASTAPVPSRALPAGVPFYPWHTNIGTTVFWIGENASKNNPIPNDKSSWDEQWKHRFGGVDTPGKREAAGRKAPPFTPRQNPYYVALPYNDVDSKNTKPEAALVIPWFRAAFTRNGVSVLKGRWVAIRKGDRVCYAQWEDVGPFRTDHWQYVFGNARPKANLNKGAGLDVSPSVQDYLGLKGTDVTDWKFVEFFEVPPGPWREFGTNNIFVSRRSDAVAMAEYWRLQAKDRANK